MPLFVSSKIMLLMKLVLIAHNNTLQLLQCGNYQFDSLLQHLNEMYIGVASAMCQLVSVLLSSHKPCLLKQMLPLHLLVVQRYSWQQNFCLIIFTLVMLMFIVRVYKMEGNVVLFGLKFVKIADTKFLQYTDTLQEPKMIPCIIYAVLTKTTI